MTLLILGLILWIVVHLMKRLAPGLRAGLNTRYGEARARGIVTGLILLSVAAMTVGYKQSELTHLYDSPSWARPVNNLLVLIAFILAGMGNSRGKLRAAMRHPMLTAMVVWAIAHLLMNGDVPSVVLFGGLGLWAIISMLVINAQEGPWQRPEPGPISGDIKLVVIGTVIFSIVAGLHILLGPNPFTA